MRLDNFTGQLFKGALHAPTAKFLVTALRRAAQLGAKRVVNPCVGTFGLVRVAVAAGFEPSSVLAGDIGLMSAILGFSIMGRPLAELGIRFLDPSLAPAGEFAGTELEAGATLAAMKACQYKATNVFGKLLLDDILGDWQRAATAIQQQVEARVVVLRGCSFELADMWAQIDAAADDPEAVICLFPPAYRNGYERMFPTAGRIEWAAPKVPQFDPASQLKLYRKLCDGRALALWSYYGQLPADAADRTIFSEWAAGRKSPERWLANRPDGLPKGVHTRRETPLEPSPFPLWPMDREVTAAAQVRFVETNKSVAFYYRDLFAHKLGVTRAERFFLVLLDGHLMSVFGTFFDQIDRGVSGTVLEQFGFTVPNRVHARISRFFMMLLVCGDAREFFQSCVRSPLRKIDTLQTTCIAPHPEVKTDRGILKLRERTTLPDGRYKLVYAVEFNTRSFADVITAWQAKDGKVRPKQRGASDGGADSGGGGEPRNLADEARRVAGAGRQRAGDAARDAGTAG